jgi:hypothetical protein
VVSGRLLSVDLFDRPATCQRVWNRMLSGMVLDAVEAGTTGEPPEAGIVEQTVRGLGQLDWERVETVGLGEESRAKGLGLLASMLAWDGVPVHVSMVAE